MSYDSSGSSFPNYGAVAGDSPSRNSHSSSGVVRCNQLSDNISSSIFAINNNVAAIERAFKQLATPTDTIVLRDKVHKTIHETSARVSQTAVFLRELTELNQQGDKTERLQLQRLKNEFQETVGRFGSLQKQVATKMKYSQPVKRSVEKGSWQQQYEDDGDPEDEKAALMEAENRMQRQKQLEADLEFEQTYYLEREQRIGQIETDMYDVNQIMRELATLVNLQAEPIHTIEANVERASSNVDEGRAQLIKASQYQKSARKKMCIFIVLLLIIGGVIAIILFFTLKK